MHERTLKWMLTPSKQSRSDCTEPLHVILFVYELAFFEFVILASKEETVDWFFQLHSGAAYSKHSNTSYRAFAHHFPKISLSDITPRHCL